MEEMRLFSGLFGIMLSEKSFRIVILDDIIFVFFLTFHFKSWSLGKELHTGYEDFMLGREYKV